MIPHLAASTGPAGTFTPSQPGAPEYDQGGFEQEEPLTEERMLGIVKTFLVTTPNVFKKPWLAVPDEELLPFVHELTLYCNAHDIDPAEYIGDWFPLAMAGVAVGAGALQRHRAHKKEGKDTDHGQPKKNQNSSSGITNPRLSEEEKQTELTEEIEYGQPDKEHNGGFVADDAEETADSEPSERIL